MIEKNNIILIGMPGAGKSTVGVLLAKTLGKRFMDTDLVIQQNEQQLLQNIIDEKGMEAFLEAENRALLSIQAENTVIATGGSAVYCKEGMDHLHTKGTIIYLNVPIDRIIERLNNISTRGIAMKQGHTIEDVYLERQKLYETYADIIIDCQSSTIEMTIDSIVSELS